eukprot:GILK01005502.1.p1 GENE.GILK01005502.1~~GILK01005502.1.p1  ORF type:complete len:441 (-),score=15.93 GILK01005502.1:120-1442(-)
MKVQVGGGPPTGIEMASHGAPQAPHARATSMHLAGMEGVRQYSPEECGCCTECCNACAICCHGCTAGCSACCASCKQCCTCPKFTMPTCPTCTCPSGQSSGCSCPSCPAPTCPSCTAPTCPTCPTCTAWHPKNLCAMCVCTGPRKNNCSCVDVFADCRNLKFDGPGAPDCTCKHPCPNLQCDKLCIPLDFPCCIVSCQGCCTFNADKVFRLHKLWCGVLCIAGLMGFELLCANGNLCASTSNVVSSPESSVIVLLIFAFSAIVAVAGYAANVYGYRFVLRVMRLTLPVTVLLSFAICVAAFTKTSESFSTSTRADQWLAFSSNERRHYNDNILDWQSYYQNNESLFGGYFFVMSIFFLLEWFMVIWVLHYMPLGWRPTVPKRSKRTSTALPRVDEDKRLLPLPVTNRQPNKGGPVLSTLLTGGRSSKRSNSKDHDETPLP